MIVEIIVAVVTCTTSVINAVFAPLHKKRPPQRAAFFASC